MCYIFSMSDEPRYLTLRDANQSFAARVREVEETGREFVVTRHGKPVARIAPVEPVGGADRAKARAELRAAARKGLKLGYKGPQDRDSLYDRGR
jgi:prevent-host-death family protein